MFFWLYYMISWYPSTCMSFSILRLQDVSEELSVYCLFWRVGFSHGCNEWLWWNRCWRKQSGPSGTSLRRQKHVHVEVGIPQGSENTVDRRWEFGCCDRSCLLVHPSTGFQQFVSKVESALAAAKGEAHHVFTCTQFSSFHRRVQWNKKHTNKDGASWTALVFVIKRFLLLGLRWLLGALWRNLHIWNCW